MVYAVSDLHGYPLDRFLKLLEKAGFGPEDDLYILGDVIDRNGDGGVAMLRWIMDRPNAELILGNHEAFLLACRFLFEEITEANIEALENADLAAFCDWMGNGGDVTLQALREHMRTEPDIAADILDFLADAPLMRAISLDAGDFVLTHAGLGGFSPEKKLSAYTHRELLWHRPALDENYFPDITVVFGHTPTAFYGEDHRGHILRTATWIDIDAGAGWGEEPVLLRLDDMREFRL